MTKTLTDTCSASAVVEQPVNQVVSRDEIIKLMVKAFDKGSGPTIEDYAASICDALIEAGVIPQWRGIEQAPVNESVLVWIPNREHYGEPVYRGLQVDMGTGRRWQVNGLSMGRDCGASSQPTHFQYLPTPPQAGGE